MTTKKVYLRLVGIYTTHTVDYKMDIFEGNIKKDKAYWIRYSSIEVMGKKVKPIVRYFELKEVKE